MEKGEKSEDKDKGKKVHHCVETMTVKSFVAIRLVTSNMVQRKNTRRYVALSNKRVTCVFRPFLLVQTRSQ
jgi:hypothetical protein